MRTYLLAFGAFVFVQVISEQIHYKGTLTVDATNASGHYSNSVLLSIRSCDEGIPGPVQNLTNSVDGQTATISWSPPEDASCVNEYTIFYDNQILSTTNTNYTISSLLYCSVYEIHIAAVSSNGTAGDNSSTTVETWAPYPFGAVRNFKLTLIERILNATWDPPEGASTCVGKYVIQAWDQNNAMIEDETNETYYVFSPVVGCMTYNVQVKPWVNQSMEGSTSLQTLSAGDLSTNPPTNASGTTVGKTWANLMWATDSYTINMCTITGITVRCESFDAAEWVISLQNLEANITDSTTRPNIATNVTGLSEFTNYSCVAYITNSGGNSEESDPFSFQTLEEVPSAPESLTEGFKTAAGFNFSWLEPYKVPGILQNYGIVIERGNAQHFIPEGCDAGGETHFAIDVEADVNDYEYGAGLPNFLYTVKVNASTRVGEGPSVSIDVITLSAAPEIPRELSYSLDIAQSTDYLVNVSVSWLLPCNTNGELDHFELTITGSPTFEENENATVIQDQVERNNDIENISYEYTIQNINASFSYNITVNAVLTEGIQGETQVISFISPDGYPGEPNLNPVEDRGSNYFYITWSEPNIKNGELKNYSIKIQSHGPLYPVDDGCSIDTDTYTYVQLADVTSYNFTQAKPSYNYSIAIAAATSIGYGGDSNEEFVYTTAAKPNSPVVLGYSHEAHDLTNYNVTGFISWSAPCEANGFLSHFRVLIEGSSTFDNGTESDEIEVEDHGTFNFTIERSLKAAYSYTFSVVTVLNDTTLQSDATEITLLAPDGFPGQPILDEVNEIGSTHFYFTWSEPETKNGILQNYSVAVQSHGPLYPVSVECELDLTLYTYEWPADTTTFNFTLAKPYYNYTITVSAATSIGYGAESDKEIVNTEQAEPEPPTNLSSSYEEYDLTNYNVTSTISWRVPCEINGVLSYFKLIIEGDSTFDDGTERREANITNTGLEFAFSDFHSLKAAYNYTFLVTNVLENGLESAGSEVSLLAPEGYPAAPSLNAPFNITPNSFDISWSEPEFTNGRLVVYTLTVTPHGPSYDVPENCSLVEDSTLKQFNISASQTSHQFTEAMPYHTYDVIVKAATSRGFSVESNEQYITTERTASEPVENLNHTVEYGDSVQYDPKLTLSFERPCHTYGTLIGYSITLIGEREGKEPHQFTNETDLTTYTTTSLKPEYSYTISVRVLTDEQFQSEPVNATFVSQAGVPLGVTTDEVQPPEVEGASTALYTFSEDLFDDSNGDIIYYAIILGVYGFHEESTASTWRGTVDSWPLVSSPNATNETLPFQATPIMWNPFQESGNSTVTFHIGIGNCSTVYEDCNKPLEAETEYAFKIRGFTRFGYRDSPTVTFVTDKLASTKLAVILGAVFGAIAVVVLAAFIFIIWRRRRQWFERKVSVIETPSAPPPIPVKEFPQYYSNLMLNYNKLKAEYTLLDSKTREINKVITVADLPEHKSKNRYCNIKPFDETRVILRRDANDNYSDYINASYLKGYSGSIDYIATQGPLETTCLDFWRMVLQENVTVIAMVAQCIEQNREKCYQYFPEKHETLDIGDGIEVRCITELNFGSYIVKNLLIQKDLEKHTLVHLQFMDWPDFGCPSETASLLELCQMMRNYHKREGGKIVVHCSAGVGRSGTLIAIDMLLQGIQANRDIDIFGTVLNLREQRPNMVQTEKQYAYIHRCLNDVIKNPLKEAEPTKPSENIYENVEFLKESSTYASSQEQLIKESKL